MTVENIDYHKIKIFKRLLKGAYLPKNIGYMAALTNDKKKALAKDIYTLGQYTFEEVAAKVGSTRQTISKWCKEGQWDELKAGMTVSREHLLKGMYTQVEEINRCIRQNDPGTRYATPAQADTLSKLSAAIKKLEMDTGISDLVSAGIRFAEWLRPVNMEKAIDFVNLWDAFLKEQL